MRGLIKLDNWCLGLLVCLFSSSIAFADPVGPETGRDIFFKHCKACHGNKGDGKTFAANVLNPPPKNFTSEKSKQQLTEERMTRSVTDGRKGTAMMPWESRLTSNEIEAVVNYIRRKLMGYPQ
ncbi:MAG: mono/diheme cytochrome c family protein [Nitrospinales bacterium]|jgi:mono/diheme cytochrome c family protein